MGKLFVYGCSYTFGHGLADCTADNGLDPGPIPSTQGWPNMISKHTNRKIVNRGEPGGSNKQIAYRLLNNSPDITPDDAVILQWTSPNRTIVLLKDDDRSNHSDGFKLGPWMTKKDLKTKMYYAHVQSDFDDVVMLSWYINHTNLKLKSLGITKILNVTKGGQEFSDKQFGNILTQMVDNDVLLHPITEGISTHTVDKALDGRHPGPISNTNYGNFLIKLYGDYLT